MEEHLIELDQDIVDRLSAKGILAYLAVSMSGGGDLTTAAIAGLVRSKPENMLEGLTELAAMAPQLVAKKGARKWSCGEIRSGNGVVLQNLDSIERYRMFVDDLKKYWDNLNPDMPFSMNGKDGTQIQQFLANHRHWLQEDWRKALVNRKISVVRHGQASPSQPIWIWVGRLGDYLAGPLNEYGRPAGLGGKLGKAASIEDANRDAQSAVLNGSGRGRKG